MKRRKKSLLKTVTIVDVANSLGLSTTTVSLVLNNKAEAYGISEATRDRVVKAAEEMGYTANPVARQLRTRSSGTIAVVFPHLRNDWAHSIMEGIYNIFDDEDMYPLIVTNRENPEYERKEIQSLIQRRVEGIICNPMDGNDFFYRELYERGMPLVFFSDTFRELPEISFSAWDPATVKKAVQHLVERGYKRIGYIGPDGMRYMATKRFEAFEAAISDLECEKNSDWYIHLNYRNTVREVLYPIMKQSDRPDALFTVYNDYAVAAFDSMTAMGVSIPEEMGLITLADSTVCASEKYNISVITAPIVEEGQEAARIMLQLLKDPNHEAVHGLVSGGQLIARRSTDRAGKLK